MEEYIRLQTENAQKHGQMFNWETATYGKVYCEDFNSFTDFEADFPSIVYNDALTSRENVYLNQLVTCIRKDTTPIKFDENIETNYDTPGPCCKEIDDLVYFGKRRVLNSYGHSDASSTHFCSRTQIGESTRARYQGSSSF
ncbi:hypothetical protein Tco_1374031 [Tanacetum coccineum]